MVDSISSSIMVEEAERPSLLNEREKVFLILVKEIFRLSNKKAGYLLPLLGIEKDIPYKTVERFYPDPIVMMMLNNLFIASVKRKWIVSAKTSGDGTGYSLTVIRHYHSMRERYTYHKSLDIIKTMNIELKSVRLDRYYSGQSILKDFSENTRIFIIPKRNSKIRGRRGWRKIISRFIDDPMNYLREYFRRNASESGFCK
jgi:transposase